MQAMLFAAGLGTRLKPLTLTMPKAMVPVAGEPLLAHVVRKLRGAGVDRVVVNVHHFADQIVYYLRDNGGLGVRVAVSDETGLLRETGGAVRHARTLLEDYPGQGPFLVHNVDILSNLDIPAFVAGAPGDALATLVVRPVSSTGRYLLFDGQGRLAGWTNERTGEVRSPYPGLDPGKCAKRAFAGVHLLSRGIFDAFDRYPGFGARFSIMDFYVRACRDYPIYAYGQEDLRLVDVGKLESLAAAEEFLRGL